MDKIILLLFKIRLQNSLTGIAEKIRRFCKKVSQFPNNLSNNFKVPFTSSSKGKETSLKDYLIIYKYYISKKLLLTVLLIMIVSAYPCYKILQSKGLIYKTLYETDNITYSGKVKIYDSRKNKNLVFKGTTDKGFYSGYGQLYNTKDKKTLIYKGEFKNSEFNGFGILYYENGSVECKGTFANNKLDGYGQGYYDTDKLQFKGIFKNGSYDGYGKKYYPNGIIEYIGMFKENSYNGMGTLDSDSNKTIYSGEFESGLYQGNGKLYNTKGDTIFKGKFSKGIAVEGSLIPFDGYDAVNPKGNITIFSTTDEKIKKYEGQVDDNKFQGKGTLYFEDKDNTIKYQGDFKNNLFDGIGTFYDISKAILYKGYFKEGKAAVEEFIGKSDVQLKEVLGEPDKADNTHSVDNPIKTITLSAPTTDVGGDSTFNYSKIGLSFILSKNNSSRIPKVVSVKVSSVVDLFGINANMKNDDIVKTLGNPNAASTSIDNKTNNWTYNKDIYTLTISFSNETSKISSIEICKNPSMTSGEIK